jgi:hypothetical protein
MRRSENSHIPESFEVHLRPRLNQFFHIPGNI